MHIIPVIDLQNGQVVRAVRGERARYRPIESRLCQGTDPERLARLLCEHCATDTLYLADLDALQGGAVQTEVLRRLLAALPRLRLWLDAGFASVAAAQALLASLGEPSGAPGGMPVAATEAPHGEALAARITPVFGSESLSACEALPSQAILSLDSRGGVPLDPAGLWQAPGRWPQRLVVMTLERVGSAEGPDLAALDAVRARAPGAALIGAGGIRGVADLEAAAAHGAHAWLVASALHDGQVPAGWSATNCATKNQ